MTTSAPHAPGPSPRNGNNTILRTPIIWIIFPLWGFIAITLSTNGVFKVAAGALPVPVIIAVATPALLFLAAYAMLPPLRRWVESLDIAELIALQSWRVVGFAFLIVWALGELPGAFALPAGLGDLAVGIAAPAVALAAERKTAGWKTSAYGLTAAGIFDFIVAFATGILSRQDAILHFDGAPASTLLGLMPLSLFPTFIVPAFLILHIILLLKINRY